MALYDPQDDLQYEDALDRKTRTNAHIVILALKGGCTSTTEDMIEELGTVLGDDQALGELIQRTARGENAFLDLINKIALDMGEEQAKRDLAMAPALRKMQADEARIDRAIDVALNAAV